MQREKQNIVVLFLVFECWLPGEQTQCLHHSEKSEASEDDSQN